MQDRSQAVFCNGKRSNRVELDIIVPHGCTLVPLFFLFFIFFINDLTQAISDWCNTMFVFDACLCRMGKSVREVHVLLI